MNQEFHFRLPNDDTWYSAEGIYVPTKVHKAGLQYTASGYGSKIPTTWMIILAGSKIRRRVYCMIYSNSGSCYFMYKKERIFVQ